MFKVQMKDTKRTIGFRDLVVSVDLDDHGQKEIVEAISKVMDNSKEIEKMAEDENISKEEFDEKVKELSVSTLGAFIGEENANKVYMMTPSIEAMFNYQVQVLEYLEAEKEEIRVGGLKKKYLQG